ncbi:MAG: hypothetical protein AB7J34_16575 [Limisphaerales bacterium]
MRLSDVIPIDRLIEIGVRGLMETDPPFEILRDALGELAAGGRYGTALIACLVERLRTDPTAFPKFLTVGHVVSERHPKR